MCPSCSNEEETWFTKQGAYPNKNIQCNNCSYIYLSSDHVSQLLALRGNNSLSLLQILSE